jgi:GT2 family glycosyltransferase
MQVSFIVPLFNCLALTQAMLASLRATLPANLVCEIIFVDDGSTDGTKGWLRDSGFVNGSSFGSVACRAILNEKNRGFAATCNRGAGEARGEFIFLNNDLVLLPHWLEPMLEILSHRENTGVVGNVQISHATGEIDHTGIFFNLKGKPEHDTTRPLIARFKGHRRVTAATGACLALRAATWRQLGGFDEGFRNGAEDVDLCLRAEAAGLQNHVSFRSVVRHHISQSIGRKLRDEQNTRRLVVSWRQVIVQKIARRWCWRHLEIYWPDPRDYPDPAFARHAFYHILHLQPRPPAGALICAQQAIEVELERWDELAANQSTSP